MFNFTVHAINLYLIICQTETNNHPMMKENRLLNCKWQRSFDILRHIVSYLHLY